MPQPNLLHPINVVIEPLANAANETIFDTNAREQVQIVGRKPTVRLAAQVEYRDFVQHGQADARYMHEGFVGEERGYILIRYIDARAKSYTPRIGDRIVMIGEESLEPQSMMTYVHRLKPTIHYPRLGKTAVKLYFADRKPAINGQG